MSLTVFDWLANESDIETKTDLGTTSVGTFPQAAHLEVADVDGDGDLDFWSVTPTTSDAFAHQNIFQWTTLGGASGPAATSPRLEALGEPVGGTLHAFLKNVPVLVITDGVGDWSSTFPWAPTQAGLDLWVQAIVQDGSVPAGLTPSNGLHARTR